MFRIVQRAAYAALALLCLCLSVSAPRTAFAAGPLPWAPPALVNPVTVTVQPGNFSYWANGRDVILKWPGGKHVGAVSIADFHNLVSLGGWTTVPAQLLANGQVDLSNNAPARILELSLFTGVAHVEGLLGDASGGAMSDGIDIAAPAGQVQLENVRIDGIYGFFDQFHADCIQPFGGVGALRVYNFTCRTAYQGLSIWPVAGSPASYSADLRNINVTTLNAPIYGAHNNGGYVFWPCAGQICPNTTLSEVWLQPRPGAPMTAAVMAPATAWTTQYVHPYANFPNLPFDGHVTVGTPPGGDFVPAGVAGAAYASPGYAP